LGKAPEPNSACHVVAGVFRAGVSDMTNSPAVPKDAKDTGKTANVSHPGMMGDGTEEQNLNEVGNSAARVKQDELDAAFDKKSPKKP
jgi:hypothetical protein